MFRGKESSNRIELSRLVQDLLNFGVLGSLQLLGWGWWVDGGWGWVDAGWGMVWGCPHTCAHACTCVHGKHDNFMQIAASLGFLGNPWEFHMMSYAHAHACACMCMCVWGTLSPLITPLCPPTLQGGPLESLKIQ